jgi:hypothetical protein
MSIVKGSYSLMLWEAAFFGSPRSEVSYYMKPLKPQAHGRSLSGRNSTCIIRLARSTFTSTSPPRVTTYRAHSLSQLSRSLLYSLDT